jgi:hypothetical protein
MLLTDFDALTFDCRMHRKRDRQRLMTHRRRLSR